MFDENGATPAGKSQFGKLPVRYDHRVFSVDGRVLGFLVDGEGTAASSPYSTRRSRRLLLSQRATASPQRPLTLPPPAPLARR